MTKAATDSFAEIEQLRVNFENAANTGNIDALMRFYSDDAILMPPGQSSIQGSQGIREFWKAFIGAGATDAVLKTIRREASGDLAYEAGEYQHTMPGADGRKTHHTGQYLVVFKRQANGELRCVADSFGPRGL